MSAPLPEDEVARLEELAAYKVLDTLPERDYDDLTALASRLLDAPIALITLIDKDRQWFKARLGTDVCESNRDQSFCAWAILDPSEVMVVEDTARDPRFETNDFVTNAPFIRFYAGAPMVNRAGRALGTLCVLDSRPRRLTDEDRTALLALSRQATNLLELRRSIDELEFERNNLRESNEDLKRTRRQLAEVLKNVSSDAVSQDYFEIDTSSDP